MCNFNALKVLDDDGMGFASDLIAALQWAVGNGIQVSNLSLGWDMNPGEAVEFMDASKLQVTVSTGRTTKTTIWDVRVTNLDGASAVLLDGLTIKP